MDCAYARARHICIFGLLVWLFSPSPHVLHRLPTTVKSNKQSLYYFAFGFRAHSTVLYFSILVCGRSYRLLFGAATNTWVGTAWAHPDSSTLSLLTLCYLQVSPLPQNIFTLKIPVWSDNSLGAPTHVFTRRVNCMNRFALRGQAPPASCCAYATHRRLGTAIIEHRPLERAGWFGGQ